MSVRAKVVLIAAGGLCAGGAAILIWQQYKKDRERLGVAKTRSHPLNLPQVVKEVVIPAKHVPAFSQRVREDLERETNTTVVWRDGDHDAKVCVIRGSAGNVAIAVSRVKEFLGTNVVVNDDSVTVPSSAVGAIIGAQGVVLKELRDRHGVRIDVDQSGNNDFETIIRLRSSDDAALAAAKRDILRIVEEKQRGRRAEAEKPAPLPIMAGEQQSTMRVSTETGAWATLDVGTNLPLEVFVSGISSTLGPKRFWVQLEGPRANDLDRLGEDMAELFNAPDAHQKYKLEPGDLRPGDVVAVLPEDLKWYRVMVCRVRPDEYDETDAEVDVFYVDSGVSDVVACSSLRRLPSEYLSLQFQAVECALAGVVSCRGGALREFGERSYFNMLKTVSLLKVGKVRMPADPPVRPEAYEVPTVRLIDHSQEIPVDIGAVLADEGFVDLKPPEEDGIGSPEAS